MRTGESLGVMLPEIYTLEACGRMFAAVPISRQMPESGHTPEEWTKTDGSERTTLVPDSYASRLMEIRDSMLSIGIEWLSDRGDGLPFNRGTLKYAWEKDAGADAIPFANLRTSWRTFAQYEWGVDFDTLEILMGHLVPGVTGKHYLKPKIDDLVNAVAKAVVQSRAS